MRLESITLHGFKSFGDRTDVKVLPGITAIVGPNGCGKSNISDAVRWALGEQSPKSLRGQKMEDVIFYGSGSRKAVGLAEVELIFSNDGTLAVPWSEIAVGRRLYRTGESEYILNKNAVRLRDILDLFAGTGANPRAYSVMDQDKLNHVLTAKPHERRVFIEEAAGIARYKHQRNETQGKLDAARQNLVRVKDVMDEVKRQLGSIERQAKKAQQYKALADERRRAALALLAADYVALTADGARLASESTALREREQALRTRLARLAAAEATQRQAIQESDHRLSDLRQSLQKIQAEFERLVERREQMRGQVREAGEDVVRLDEEIRRATERLAEILAERDAARTAAAEAARLVTAHTESAGRLHAEVERCRAALAEQRDRLEALRLEQVRIAAERSDLTRSAGELRERDSQLRRRAERLAAELAAARAEAEHLGRSRTELESERDRARAALASLTEEKARLEGQIRTVAARLAEAEATLADAKVALASRRSTLTALVELERAREGYGAGVRALFTEQGTARVAGVVGTVADLIEVPVDLERALEAVLGERLQWVVVDRFEDARAAVSFLQSNGAGAATFLPLETLPDVAPTGDDAADSPVRRVAAYSPALAHYLLGRVVVVEDLDRAEALWRQNGRLATYATPAGEVLAPTGRLRGGAGAGEDGTAASLLGRKRHIRELEEEVGRLATATAAAEQTVAALTAEATTLDARLRQVDGEIHAGEAAGVAGDKDLERIGREQERVERHLETIRFESDQVAAERDETAAVLARLEQRLAATLEAENAHEQTMSSLRATVEAAQREDAARQADLTARRVELASLTERVEALGREVTRLDDIERELTLRVGQADSRRAEIGDRRAWLVAELERTDVAARDVATERDRAEAELREAGEHHESLLGALRALEHDIREAEAELSRLVTAVHDVELQATERRVRREELAQEASRTFGVDESALAAANEVGRDLVALRQRLGELDERLQALGPVNLVADEEYRELDERLSFLRTQHDDLTASIKDLEKALRGMTRTAHERFAHAFEEINRRFGEIFARLFEGGRAELRLVEAEEGGDPLDTGVELMAQPRGKRLQAVTLLSGGERALTGLALLFAIFYFRPSPFCVLDEVDAPLDDANIHRFLRVLRELTSQTQFLVITHNRRTMEAADVLYGVTMEEPGLSKLVSVRLNA
jgi:chromosome segregation protein